MVIQVLVISFNGLHFFWNFVWSEMKEGDGENENIVESSASALEGGKKKKKKNHRKRHGELVKCDDSSPLQHLNQVQGLLRYLQSGLTGLPANGPY